MKFNHQLREALYNKGFKMSPTARRLEADEQALIKEGKRLEKDRKEATK